jgi:anti-sigma factor RsiW
MKIDENTLRAYVDGELSPAERSSVELAVEHSEDLRAQLAAMRASCLPYRAAFDAQVVPAMPEALQRQLAALSAVSVASVASAAQVVQPVAAPKYAQSGWFQNRLALAASFAVGALAAMVFGAMWTKPDASSTVTADWVKAIASYQALYVRDTVDRAADSDERAFKVIRDFEAETQAKLIVPNLSAAGLEFKRIQRLGFRESDTDKPLIQMAYLPAKGKPGALCVLQTKGNTDSAVKAQRMENLSIVTWKRGNLSYVLAVDLPLNEAAAIGDKLSAEQFPVLFKS